jgi:hypothetical protein
MLRAEAPSAAPSRAKDMSDSFVQEVVELMGFIADFERPPPPVALPTGAAALHPLAKDDQERGLTGLNANAASESTPTSAGSTGANLNPGSGTAALDKDSRVVAIVNIFFLFPILIAPNPTNQPRLLVHDRRSWRNIRSKPSYWTRTWKQSLHRS